MFGNKELLHVEAGRKEQEAWLRKAGLKLPATFKSPDDIDRLAIAKLPGAQGGRGYFLAASPEGFDKRFNDMVRRGLLKAEDRNRLHLQEYVQGVNVYPSYFSSIVRNDVELLAADRRYESAVDAIGRIPASEQLEVNVSPSYTVVGNFPVVIRESLLPELMRMGDSVHETAKSWRPRASSGPSAWRPSSRKPGDLHVRDLRAHRGRDQRRHRHVPLRVPEVRREHVHGKAHRPGNKRGHRAGKTPRRPRIIS